MKNYFLVVLVIILALFFIVSCDDSSQATGSLKLILKVGEQGSRSLLPEDTCLDVTRYVVTGEGPGGKTFSVNSESSAITIEGLNIGEWNITAKGLNNNNLELVKGVITHEITKNSSPVTIILNQLVGSADFHIELSWASSDVPNPELTVYLKGPDKSTTERILNMNVDYTNNSASYSERLASGSYTLRAVLKSGDVVASGLVEAVRIVNGIPTNGNLDLDFQSYSNSTGTLFIANNSGIPVTGHLSGLETEEESNKDKTVSFEVDDNFKNYEGLEIQWFLDGNPQGDIKALTQEGDSIVINTNPGSHRLDVVVSNDKLGSTGSVTFPFTSKITGNQGQLVKVSEMINGTNGLKISNDSIITALPGERFLIATPSLSSIQICRVANNNLSILRNLGPLDFSWIPDIKMISSDVNSGVLAFYDTENGNCVTFMKFVSDTNNIALLSDTSRFVNEIKTGLTIQKVDALVLNNALRGAYIIDSVEKKIHFFSYANGGLQRKGMCSLLSVPEDYTNVKSCCFSKSGNNLAMIVDNKSDFLINPVADDVGFLTAFTRYNAELIEPEVVKFIRDDSIIIGTEGKLKRYSFYGDSFTLEQTLDIEAEKLVVSDMYKYIYASAKAQSSIFCYSINSDGIIEENGQCDFSSNPSQIILNGAYFLVLTNNAHLSLCRVVLE
ncbi:MAG: hypothetical protein WC162_06045 [Sphaerochaetaceae bacterium]